ncbi:hypothetical protein DENSPDRAFT_373195 [Dentipellis sp. KUC8613]|nr:hypothetical protein DENSPDRAFT_373195 [Dentipellis sp. KUC8613]
MSSTKVLVTVDGARNEIDEDLKRLHESMLVLKSRRNRLSPIARLPPETIALIFSFVVQLSYPRTPNDRRLSWMAVAHVCRQWRDIALQHPRLWSRIDFTSTACAKEMLRRAKMAPLQIYADFNSTLGCKADLQALLLALPHASRANLLSISAPHQTLSNIVQQLSSPAPLLEKFGFHNEQGLPWGIDYVPSLPIKLPESLLAGHAPNLRHLELSGCDIRWSSPLLKGLRHLEILDLSANRRPTMTEWLDALENMPYIEELMLHESTPITPLRRSAPPPPSRTVTLTNLVQLDLSSKASSVASVLNHIHLPKVLALRVDCKSEVPDGEDVLPLVPLIARHSHGDQDPGPLRSLIMTSGSHAMKVIAFSEPDQDHKVDNPMEIIAAVFTSRMTFTVNSPIWGQDVSCKVLFAAIDGLPLTEVQTITAQDVDGPSARIWPRCLSWKSVEKLNIVGRDPLEFAAYLHNNACMMSGQLTDAPATTEDLPAGLFFPRLEHMTFQRAKLFAPAIINTFCDAFMQRCELGAALQHLDITHSTINPTAVTRLRDIVPALHWDLIEHSSRALEDGFDDDVESWLSEEEDEDDEGGGMGDEDPGNLFPNNFLPFFLSTLASTFPIPGPTHPGAMGMGPPPPPPM